MEKKNEKKDVLEKISKYADVFNKVFIGILLVIITSIFTWRSSIISDAIKEGEFEVKKMEYEQKLLDDFMFKDTSENRYMRQDIALAILYDFLKKDTSRKEFLLDVALIVALDTSRNMHNVSNLPYDIIKRLDGGKGRELQYDYSKSQASLNNISLSIANIKDTAKLSDIYEIDTGKYINFELFNKLAGKETIFIQIKNYSLNKRAEDIRQVLLDTGYLVPSIQVVDGDYDNSIRYFNTQDYTAMKTVFNIIGRIDSIKIPNIRILDLTKSNKFKAPTGQVELWISSVN